MSKKKKHAIIKNSYFWASIAEASTISFTDGGEMCLNLIPCDKEINLLLHVVMDYKAGKARDDYRKQYPFAATCTAKAQLIRKK